MDTERVGLVLIDGDRVDIDWVLEMTSSDGKKRLLDELALQKRSGDRIVEEEFYYDPATQVRVGEDRDRPQGTA